MSKTRQILWEWVLSLKGGQQINANRKHSRGSSNALSTLTTGGSTMNRSSPSFFYKSRTSAELPTLKSSPSSFTLHSALLYHPHLIQTSPHRLAAKSLRRESFFFSRSSFDLLLKLRCCSLYCSHHQCTPSQGSLTLIPGFGHGFGTFT